MQGYQGGGARYGPVPGLSINSGTPVPVLTGKRSGSQDSGFHLLSTYGESEMSCLPICGSFVHRPLLVAACRLPKASLWYAPTPFLEQHGCLSLLLPLGIYNRQTRHSTFFRIREEWSIGPVGEISLIHSAFCWRCRPTGLIHHVNFQDYKLLLRDSPLNRAP